MTRITVSECGRVSLSTPRPHDHTANAFADRRGSRSHIPPFHLFAVDGVSPTSTSELGVCRMCGRTVPWTMAHAVCSDTRHLRTISIKHWPHGLNIAYYVHIAIHSQQRICPSLAHRSSVHRMYLPALTSLCAPARCPHGPMTWLSQRGLNC